MATITSTNTILVNPAFLQEIKDSHPDLWHTVHELRQTCHCDQSPAQLAKRLVRQLDDLRDHLALQFALEESYGFIEVEGAPSHSELSDLATEAHCQHCSLYLRLSDLAERAEELQYRGVAADQLRKLIESTQEFDSLLRQHEQLENELIDRSFDTLPRRV